MKIGLKLSLGNAFVVVVIMVISVVFLIGREIKQSNEEILGRCRAIVEQLKLTREYLAEALTFSGDVILSENLAHYIPARAAYGIGNKFTKATGYILKQTSLKLRNPNNAPDEFEIRVLKMFENDKGRKEYWIIDSVERDKYFRYMYRLEVKEMCLNCHGDREKVPQFIKENYKDDTATDYKLGDVRGAISVTVPYSKVADTFQARFNYLFAVGSSIACICIGTVFFLSRRLVSLPLKKLYKEGAEMVRENLDQKIEIASNNEIGNLAELLNEMAYSLSREKKVNEKTNNLSQLINENKEAITQLSVSSSEMLSTNENQARGASELADSVSEVIATMEELSASARRTASDLELLNKFAESSTIVAQQGKVAFIGAINIVESIMNGSRETANRILSLEGKSKQIGEALKIIHDISSKIQLLSVNAAVEASGAGKFGRRFGVVVGEMRKLAERTMISTEDIRNILEEVQSATNAVVTSTEQEAKNLSHGMEIAKTAVQTSKIISESVEKTFDASKQIVMAIHHQKSTSEQVARTMNEISEKIKQTVVILKQSNATIAELSKLAKDLEEKNN